MADYQDAAFIEYVVKQLVENADAVQVSRTVDDMGVKIELTVDPKDMGRVIGKEGRTAKALRTLLRVLGAKNNARVSLIIMEPGGGRAMADDGEDNESAPAPVETPMTDEQPAEEEIPAEQPEKPAEAKQPADDTMTEVL